MRIEDIFETIVLDILYPWTKWLVAASERVGITAQLRNRQAEVGLGCQHEIDRHCTDDETGSHVAKHRVIYDRAA